MSKTSKTNDDDYIYLNFLHNPFYDKYEDDFEDDDDGDDENEEGVDYGM
jgi:hypothetical protein